jgi:competence protein ComEC
MEQINTYNNMRTRFRAFQLDSPGSLFCYYKPGEYTLIEARVPKGGIDVLKEDLEALGLTKIGILHITSWDDDHCNYDNLTQILNHLRPTLIELPSYEPTSETGKLCRRVLFAYDVIHQKNVWNVVVRDRTNISSLQNAVDWGDNHVCFHSLYDTIVKNDMSQIKLFRSQGFNVLSLGDCESEQISNGLMNFGIIRYEVDVLILPHHGASNSCLTGALLDAVKPRLAVCSSNFDNEYDHPREDVRQLLANRNIPLMTTKRGDVVITCKDDNNTCLAFDLSSNNRVIQKGDKFSSKRCIHEMRQLFNPFQI